MADVTKRLADTLTPTDLRPGSQARITELVLLLDPLETYWAYPGRGQLQQIGALCDTGDYQSAMRLTDTVSRQLSVRDDPTGPPAFQVLVVDDVPTPQADALRAEIHSTASDDHDVTSVNVGVSVRGRAMNCVSQRLRGDTADSAGRLIGPHRRSHGGLTSVVRTGGSP